MKFLVLLFLLAPTARATSQLELNGVLAHVAALHDQGITPIVVSDLDETLIDSIPRRFRSFQQAVTEACPKPTEDCTKAGTLTLADFEALPNRYDQAPLYDRVELSFGFRRGIQKQLMQYYLSENFVSLDQPIPGAVEFIRELRNHGAVVYFASARSDHDVRAATISSLEQLGFAEKNHPERLLLRAEDETSIGFKRRAFGDIKAFAAANHAEVQLVMENEPENMNAMTEIFPAADAVFVEGAFAKPGHVNHNPIRIEDFQ